MYYVMLGLNINVKININKYTNVYIFRKKRQAPFMIFPEILVIVDYDGYR